MIVDLRSADYAAMWRPDARSLDRVVTVRVLSPRPGGGLAVISYFSKHGKGRLARALIQRVAAGDAVASASDIGRIWAETEGGDAVLTEWAGRIGLDLITAD